ncbi:MAG: ABC transporter substrate-binding protein [Burkholderiales bacterium]|nr:ABC transporter substrate-binding protein [Burkholderiales bacterium]
MSKSLLNRRRLLTGAVGLPFLTAQPTWAQALKQTLTARNLSIAQIVDTSTTQQDVSRDFLIGSRAAWQDINARGGVRGRPIQHLVLEVDGSMPSLRTALETVRTQPQCLALCGTAGDRTAAQLVQLLRQEQLDIAHAAPWLHNADGQEERTFCIFASRQEQIAHALKSLSTNGVAELGAVYASAQENALYRADVERAAADLKLRLTSYTLSGSLRQAGTILNSDTPAILLFLGGTPELAQFTQGMEKQTRQRYVIALADINLQTMAQLGAARNTPVVATQVVPMVNAGLPVVRAYRETLARLFDEVPTALSLAGFIAARYTQEVLQTIEPAPTRQNVLQAFQRRAPLDLGGFRISFNGLRRGSPYVTQSMLSLDGRIVG